MLAEHKIDRVDSDLIGVVDEPHEVVVRAFRGAELQGFELGSGARG